MSGARSASAVTRSERSDKLNGINARPDKLLSLKRANVSVDDSSFGRPKRTKWPPENSILRSKNSPHSSIGLRPLTLLRPRFARGKCQTKPTFATEGTLDAK